MMRYWARACLRLKWPVRRSCSAGKLRHARMDASGTSDAEIIRWANETRLSAIVLAVEAQRLEVLLERLTALDIPLINTVPTSR